MNPPIGTIIRLTDEHLRDSPDECFRIISEPYERPNPRRMGVDIERVGLSTSENDWANWPLNPRDWEIYAPGPPYDLEERV